MNDKYIQSMIEEGKKLMETENKLRFQVGLEGLYSSDDKFYYNLAKYNKTGNDTVVQAIRLGKYIPVTMVQKNESLQRCITNESCYYLNMSHKSDLEETFSNRLCKYIDFYNSIIDSIPSDTEYESL